MHCYLSSSRRGVMNNLSSINHTNFNRLYELTNNYNKATLLDKLIYWWQISNYTLNDEKVWFTRSTEQISAESKISQRSVERYLKEFKDLGYIEKTNKLFKKKNLYIRITDKLLHALSIVKEHKQTAILNHEKNNHNKKSVILSQNGGTNPAILAESINKEKYNKNLTNSTVKLMLEVRKQEKTKRVLPIKYPVYPVEQQIGKQLAEREKNYIKGMMSNLQQQHHISISSPEQLFAEIVFSVLNDEQLTGISEFRHRIQIIAKLLREKRWKTPKGFYKYADYSQRFKTNSTHENNQLLKKLKAKINDLNTVINSESHYLAEASNTQQNKLPASQELLNSITNKLSDLYEQRAQAIQELNQLKEGNEQDIYKHQEKNNRLDNNPQEIQNEISKLRLLANQAFNNFCEVSQRSNKKDGRAESLYQYYEQIQNRLTKLNKQRIQLE